MIQKDKISLQEKSKLRFILRKLINDTRIKEAELSRILNISKSTLHQLLNMDNISPQIETLRPIAKYFNITIDQLIGDSPLDNADNTAHQIDDNDLREWNPNLYKQCVDEVCATLKIQKNSLPAIRVLHIIKEIYFYSLGKKDKKVDKEFSKWLINTQIKK